MLLALIYFITCKNERRKLHHLTRDLLEDTVPDDPAAGVVDDDVVEVDDDLDKEVVPDEVVVDILCLNDVVAGQDTVSSQGNLLCCSSVVDGVAGEVVVDDDSLACGEDQVWWCHLVVCMQGAPAGAESTGEDTDQPEQSRSDQELGWSDLVTSDLQMKD